jgi:TetR/AcrR family transcriptional repressor of nem operon
LRLGLNRQSGKLGELTSRRRHEMMTIMRYPDGHKEAVRERIVETAAEELRAHGLDGVSIPALMKRVGLTHGGFYSHFENRDSLVAAAVLAAGRRTGKQTFADERTLKETLRHYLSTGHVRHPEQGCVIAALGSDGTRQPTKVRAAFAEVARGLLGLVERKLNPKRATKQPSDEALRMTATMVGAVVLARLVDDPELAERILRAAENSAST